MKIKATIFCLVVLMALSYTPEVYAWHLLQPRAPKQAEVPVIMYHLITDKSKYVGKHGITPEEMERDFIYLKENGYETVDISDLINFVERGKALPKNPVMLTFDDGNSSDYKYLYPMLKKYKMKAVAFIIGKATEVCSLDSVNNTNQPHLTWDQIKELHKSNYVEIQSHSYNLHGAAGSGKRRGESEEEFKKRLSGDLEKLQVSIKENINFTPTAFAYPLGVISNGSKEALKEMGFKASLSCRSGMNILKQGDPDCLFQLKRVNRSNRYPISSILKDLEKD